MPPSLVCCSCIEWRKNETMENIFHTYKDKWTMDYKGVTASKSADNDSCFVYLSLTYQFRRLKGYSGRGTRNSEAGRLNML